MDLASHTVPAMCVFVHGLGQGEERQTWERTSSSSSCFLSKITNHHYFSHLSLKIQQWYDAHISMIFLYTIIRLGPKPRKNLILLQDGEARRSLRSKLKVKGWLGRQSVGLTAQTIGQKRPSDQSIGTHGLNDNDDLLAECSFCLLLRDLLIIQEIVSYKHSS